MKIGYIYRSYPEKRCIIDKTKNDYIYYDIKKSLIYMIKSILQKMGLYTYWDKQACVSVPDQKADIWHTFNQILNTNKPYIITYETALPRNSETIEREWEWNNKFDANHMKRTYCLIRKMNKSNCRKLLAISNIAMDIMRYQLEALNVEHGVIDSIMRKTEVLYPPQKQNCTVDELKTKYFFHDGIIKFVFVGNEYFKKGGYFLTEELKKLKNKERIHLTIISAFNGNFGSGIDENERCRHLNYIQKQSWISCYSNLPNEETMEIMREAHVGFLPTIQDTFGYSVLEMQASGCPVVTTDIRALPEINGDEYGWMIYVKQHKISKEALYHNEESLKEIHREITSGLASIIHEILEKWNRKEYAYFLDRAERCLDRIQRIHDPHKYEDRLSEIYQQVYL